MCEQHNTGDSHYNNKRQKPIYYFYFFLLIFLPHGDTGRVEHVHEIVIEKMSFLSVVIEGVLWTYCLMEIVGQNIYSSVNRESINA